MGGFRARARAREGLWVGEGPWGVATHKRTVEAARKARSRRPAREERMEAITIIQPLRRPGHVSMELGDLPAHTGLVTSLSPHPPSCLMKPSQPPEPIHLSISGAPVPSAPALVCAGLSLPMPHTARHAAGRVAADLGMTMPLPCSSIQGLQMTRPHPNCLGSRLPDTLVFARVARVHPQGRAQRSP